MNHLCKLKHKRRGQGLLEYIVLTALVAVVCLGTVKTLGSKVKHHITRASNTFDRTMRQGLANGRARASTSTVDDDNDDAPSPSNAPSLPRTTRGFSWPF